MTPPLTPKAFRDELRGLLECLPDTSAGNESASQIRKLREEIVEAIDILKEYSIKLDPVRQPEYVLDPADPQVMGRLIAETLLTQPVLPLGKAGRFYGSGVYALYYTGRFKAYVPISGVAHPIYVGSAAPAAPDAATVEAQGESLANRLREHGKSVANARNLDLSDFTCRYLVVKSAWQATAELHLINRFQPVWNKETNVCFGFGKHGDSSSTRKNKRSPWDTLHPGRLWAETEETEPNSKNAEQIILDILAHFKKNPPMR